MQTSSEAVQANHPTLNRDIAEAVRLQQQIGDLTAQLDVRREGIKCAMKAAKVTRYATPEGHEALVITRTVRSWLVEKLQDVLDVKRFRLLCPRTPQAKELGKILEADPVLGAQLEKKGCFTATTQDVLSVRAPAKEQKAGNDVDIDAMSGTGRPGTTWPAAKRNGD